MTILVARPPLQDLSMSAMQTGSRRLSARLQQKDTTHAGKGEASGSWGGRKRKNEYDEDDEGFAFTRVNKNKKPRSLKQDATVQTTTAAAVTNGASTSKESAPSNTVETTTNQPEDVSTAEDLPRKRRKKMSFSTPKAKEPQPVRRSKRLSNEVAKQEHSPVSKSTSDGIRSNKRSKAQPEHNDAERTVEPKLVPKEQNDGLEARSNEDSSESGHSATKIALPFADTPVIRRNKAMREGKSIKGDRRSSLGLRGRRASSLIETGNSSALPHQEVGVTDFYKHIESDLMEPRRMRQLLTWCATRAMHAKPKGTDFEDASAKSAARVIEEELLKDLSNKSELSDWFSREDIQDPPKSLPERPHPKNLQNTQKIRELEEQIQKLKRERDALQQLLQPPEVSMTENTITQTTESLDSNRHLLSTEDAAVLETVVLSSHLSEQISRRVNDIASNLGPTIDRFTDGVHKMAQYRTATDNIAGKVLSICAERLASRERAGRKKALHTEEDRSPGRDLSNVLRGLSKADR